MFKYVLAFCGALLMVGCGPQSIVTHASPQTRVREFRIAVTYTYVVDSTTESCFLYKHGIWAVQVDCAKLKQKLPEARKVITWIDDAPTAPVTSPVPSTPATE